MSALCQKLTFRPRHSAATVCIQMPLSPDIAQCQVDAALPRKQALLERVGMSVCADNERWQRLYARSNNCFAISATLGSRGRGFKDSPFPRISIIIVNTATRPYGLSFAGTKYQGARFSEVFSSISSIAASYSAQRDRLWKSS